MYSKLDGWDDDIDSVLSVCCGDFDSDVFFVLGDEGLRNIFVEFYEGLV